jgi:phage terminase small subunit
LYQSQHHRKHQARRAQLPTICFPPEKSRLDTPPRGLSPEPAAAWLRIAPALICKRLIQPADAGWFRRFCTAYAIWLRATDKAVSGKSDTERKVYADVEREFSPLIDEFLEDIGFHSPSEFESFLRSSIQ